MQFIHPHKAGKILGVIHEDALSLQPIDLVRAALPPQRPSQYLLDPIGAFFSLVALMQGFTSGCGGYSLAQLINLLMVLRKLAKSAQLSGSFDYAFEKTVDGVPQLEGTTIGAVGKAGQLAGSCLDSLFPDDGALSASPQGIVTTPYSSASAQAIADAATRELGQAFALTDLSMGGIHQACFENGGVILEVQVGDEWYTAPDGADSWEAEDILPIRPPKKVIDSHFILVSAYDEPNDRTWFVNSWSQQWGKNGFGWLTSDYAPFIVSGIAFRDVPASVSQVLNAPAIPTPQKQAIVQQIIRDIEQALGLIGKEVGSL